MGDTPAFKDAPWPAIAPPARPLDADASADVCVVGAGIAGLCVAYALSKRGRSVVVLDDGPVAGGETRRSTAHLASALDDRIYHLEWVHGEEGARLAAASHAAAIDWIERAVAAERIECGFRRVDGYLVVPPRRLGEREALLDREFEAARRAGLQVDRVSTPPLGGALWGGALRFRAQGQMDPAAFAAGLAASITGAGGRIHTPSHVTTISGRDPCRVETREGRAVTAAHVVVATNSPVNDRLVMHTKQASYRTYAVAFPDLAGEFPDMLLWD
jgi:glycine/D-amino acid oxidase-like deaminating enzyme